MMKPIDFPAKITCKVNNVNCHFEVTYFALCNIFNFNFQLNLYFNHLYLPKISAAFELLYLNKNTYYMQAISKAIWDYAN